MSPPLIIALPKGRILKEFSVIMRKANIIPEEEFDNPATRKLRFTTNQPDLDIIVVRSFDVVTFVAFGAAHLGVAGDDVIQEFDHPEVYAPLDLGIGHCRLSVAETRDLEAVDQPQQWSHVRIATKYPSLTKRYFAAKGVQAECIKLNGAMELAPSLGLCRRIVDLVSSGATLKANGLVEVEMLLNVTSKLIVNRTALKTNSSVLKSYIDTIEAALA